MEISTVSMLGTCEFGPLTFGLYLYERTERKVWQRHVHYLYSATVFVVSCEILSEYRPQRHKVVHKETKVAFHKRVRMTGWFFTLLDHVNGEVKVLWNCWVLFKNTRYIQLFLMAQSLFTVSTMWYGGAKMFT